MNGWDVNLWAVLVSVVASVAIGALWYSRFLFTEVWLRETGLSKADIENNPSKLPLVVWLLAALVVAFALSYIHHLAGSTTVLDGIRIGLLAAIGLSAASAAPQYAFSQKSLKLYLINEGNSAIGIVVMSCIIAVWR